jgi:hypothetical protein
MTDKPFALDIIDVASPCTADWETMNGTDQVRRCGQCELNVYHLSNMTRAEAETLVHEHEGRICVRFYRRADGTVLTRDCPLGLQAIRRQLARLLAGVAAMIAFLAAGTIFCLGGSLWKAKSPPFRINPAAYDSKQSYFFRRPVNAWTKWLERGVVMGGSFRPVLSPTNSPSSMPQAAPTNPIP